MNSAAKIKLTFFLPSLEPGGTERNVVNLVNIIDKAVYDVRLVLGQAKGDFLKNVQKDILVVDTNAPTSLTLFFALISYFKQEKPDIFVSAFTRINLIAILARMFSGSGRNVKIVATEHAIFSLLPDIARSLSHKLFALFFLKTLSRLLYPKADSIICVSGGMTDDFIKNVGCAQKVKTIYNPVINEEVKKMADEEILEQEITNIKVPLIVAAGRLVECKNYPGLFKAFALVLQKQPAHLLVLGRGPEEQKLKDLAKNMGLSEHITFMGFVQNPYKYMKRASVFVLSSLQEGFGNVIIEAMAVGAPIVSTDCPTGPGEIIASGENGILVALDDEKGLAQAIVTILENPELAEKFKKQGKIRAEDFTVKKSVYEYEKVFRQLYAAR